MQLRHHPGRRKHEEIMRWKASSFLKAMMAQEWFNNFHVVRYLTSTVICSEKRDRKFYWKITYCVLYFLLPKVWGVV